MAATLLAAATPPATSTEPAVTAADELLTTPATLVETALPGQTFGGWLDGVLPRGTGRFFELVPCPAPAADGANTTDENANSPTAEDSGSLVPEADCLAVELDLISRHRTVRLLFDRTGFTFRGGVMSADELEGEIEVASLAKLPELLRRPMRPYPLDCPAGSVLKLRESHAGLFEWCAAGGGVKQGPTRAWFSTGIYLMYRGAYFEGRKTGTWIECNRFERCAIHTYANGTRQ